MHSKNANPLQDYSELIQKMQFFIEPEISWTDWLSKACFLENSLTEIGEFLRVHLNGGTLINIPCGLASDKSVLDIAQALGIFTYIEVDKDPNVLGKRLLCPKRVINGMTVHTYESDILAFIAQLEKNVESRKRAIYISGLQPQKTFCEDPMNISTVCIPYLQGLYSELNRISNTGDLVILNDAQTLVTGINEEKHTAIHPSIALTQLGFMCKRTCPYNKVQVFEKC